MYCRCVYYIEVFIEIIIDNIVRGMVNIFCYNMILYFFNGYSLFQYIYMYCYFLMFFNYFYSLYFIVNYKIKKRINYIKICFFRFIIMVVFLFKNM